MSLIQRLKCAFDKTPYEPDSDKVVSKGTEVVSLTRHERLKLQSTLHNTDDPRRTGFFLGDSLIIDRIHDHEPNGR